MRLDANILNCFIISIKDVFSQFGIEKIEKKSIKLKSKVESKYPVTIVVGLTGDLNGNITYNLEIDTAKKLASKMMMGMPVLELDDMTKSALSEISNMITGTSSGKLAELKKNTDISPPTLIIGKEIKLWISQVETIAILLDTSIGEIELNIGLEI
ncbi:MAG: hypothetical protein B6I28_05945 [Fusobacteriia bacterium 4572_132]|nr:MAG: hypothetical protein B6I28_05945 [Fusobacteriia bacterium 4572_132]